MRRMPDGPIRLQKILSGAGVASRRAAERLIVEGRVTVNGELAAELGTRADPMRDDIRVDGRRVRSAAPRIYLLLNKPRGYVTTRSDPEGRPTVLDLMKGVKDYVYPVGRLDYDSEGLLLLTNDGDLAEHLTHPRHEVERVYEVRVRGVLTPATVSRLARGVVLDGRRTAPATVRFLGVSQARGATGRPGRPTADARHTRDARQRHQGRRAHGPSRPEAVAEDTTTARGPRKTGTCTLEFTLHEGRSRQVRKMCDAVGHPVVRLRRVRIGPLRDDGLKAGSFRPLTARELSTLKRTGSNRRRG